MSILIYLALAAGAAIMYATHGTSGSAGNVSGSSPLDTNPAVFRTNPWALPDIDSANQGPGYDQTYDEAMEKASGATGVPFALIKAHAIRESNINPGAYHYDNSSSGASYGFMQVEWIAGSNRFSKYGVDDSVLLPDGSGLYDPETNALLGASIIRDNLNWLKGNLRDTINAYNTGTPESKIPAPNNYVNDVLAAYATLIGEPVT